MSKPYQDVWVKGKVMVQGYRECAERYELVAHFCSQYRRPFTVLDVGANLGYFGIRLAEQFPECRVVAVEGRPEIGSVLQENDNPRVIWLRRMLSLRDLWCLANVEAFDVVLALSVIHHLPAAPEASLEVLPLIGDHLILELPYEDTACGQEKVQAIVPPSDAVDLGRGKSHLDGGSRQILLVSRPKRRLASAYLGCSRSELAMTIYSDFARKRVRFWTKAEPERDWHAGLNLQTYLVMGGAYPSRRLIAARVREAAIDERQAYDHRDIAAWNVILQGDRVQIIDRQDPHTGRHDDKLCLERLLASLEAGT